MLLCSMICDCHIIYQILNEWCKDVLSWCEQLLVCLEGKNFKENTSVICGKAVLLWSNSAAVSGQIVHILSIFRISPLNFAANFNESSWFAILSIFNPEVAENSWCNVWWSPLLIGFLYYCQGISDEISDLFYLQISK